MLDLVYNDLSFIHKDLKEEILAKISEKIDRSDFIGGTEVQNFEREWAD